MPYYITLGRKGTNKFHKSQMNLIILGTKLDIQFGQYK